MMARIVFYVDLNSPVPSVVADMTDLVLHGLATEFEVEKDSEMGGNTQVVISGPDNERLREALLARGYQVR